MKRQRYDIDKLSTKNKRIVQNGGYVTILAGTGQNMHKLKIYKENDVCYAEPR